MSTEQHTSELEIITAVLESTRAQLSRSANLVAELDGLLAVERRRSAALRAELEHFKSEIVEKADF